MCHLSPALPRVEAQAYRQALVARVQGSYEKHRCDRCIRVGFAFSRRISRLLLSTCDDPRPGEGLVQPGSPWKGISARSSLAAGGDLLHEQGKPWTARTRGGEKKEKAKRQTHTARKQGLRYQLLFSLLSLSERLVESN